MTALAAGQASGSGSAEIRYYPSTQDTSPWSGLAGSLSYDTDPQSEHKFSVRMALEARTQTGTLRYNHASHTLQVTAQGTQDPQANAKALTVSSVYTYAVPPRPEGTSVSSVTALYVLTRSQKPQQDLTTQTGGLTFGLRFSPQWSGNLVGTGTLVQLADKQTLTGVVVGGVNYSHDGTTAYLTPTVTLQQDTQRLSLTMGGNTKFTEQLSFGVNGNWSVGANPTATANLGYQVGVWTVGGLVGYTGSGLTLGTTVNGKLTDTTSVGSTVSFAPSNRATTVSAQIANNFGTFNVGLGGTATFTPSQKPVFSQNMSISANKAPWAGSLNLSANEGPYGQSGNLGGSLSYTHEKLTVSTASALNLTRTLPAAGSDAPATTVLSGSANVALAYTVTDRLGVSGSVRYTRSASASAQPDTRFGVGLIYRF